MLSIGVPSVEDSLADFTDKLEATVLLLHMFGHVILLMSRIATVSTAPQAQTGPIPALIHLGGHQGERGWAGNEV
jgi:hypothetical protein